MQVQAAVPSLGKPKTGLPSGASGCSDCNSNLCSPQGDEGSPGSERSKGLHWILQPAKHTVLCASQGAHW